MPKKTISHNELMMLIGLTTLANHHNRQLLTLENTVKEITGEQYDSPGGGHCGDLIYGSEPSPSPSIEADVYGLLFKLDIEVLPDEPK